MLKIIRLYKYLPFNDGSLKKLSEGTIKFNKHSEFNDPFDRDPEHDIDEIVKSIGPYFLVQFSYEFAGKECYIESDNEVLIGHYIVNEVVIGPRSFTIKFGTNDKFAVHIEFKATNEEKKDLINATKDMFLNMLKVYE